MTVQKEIQTPLADDVSYGPPWQFVRNRHDDGDEDRASECSQAASPAGDCLLPINSTRSMVWIDFGLAENPLFGSLIEIPGVTVELTGPTMDAGNCSILLSMGVNKNDLSKPISDVDSEVSRFDLVLECEPCTFTEDGFGEQHNLIYGYVQYDDDDLGEARAEIMNVTKGDFDGLVYIYMTVSNYRVSSPYEQQYWTRLQDSDLPAHHAMEAGADYLNSLQHFIFSQLYFKFWFRLPDVIPERERAGASPSKQCVEERRRGSAASEEEKVQEPTLGESQSPGETVSDDRLAMTPGSPSAISPGHTRTSVLSVARELEDQMFNLEIEDVQKRRRIRKLVRENTDLKAEAMASAAQHQREAVVSEQKDKQISVIQAENDRLNKRLELERDVLCRQLEEYEDFVRHIRLMSRHLPGISVEDEASQSSDHWPVAIPDPQVDEASESSSEFPEIPDSTVDEANESDHEFPAIREPTVGESVQWSEPPSDQRFDIEPLDEAEGFPDENDPPKDEASDTAYDDDTAIGVNAFAEPPTSSSPKTAVEGHEEFNTNWAAECHNLKKMKRSAKSKRRQQKKLTEKD
ncbi:MAG: hypothetical protein OHK93_008251 [Ramalina farinacea]|uniref:Uncharacterized protein n=1 Tax=Ramalina farinacea TaxID=258253 RepID=A0AA43QP69_9LECA|nr:hypothetical protein [Ramalina farinacea]